MSIQRAVVLFLFVLFGAIFINPKNLYETVLVYERYSAGLEKKSLMLDEGEIVYLENGVKRDETLVFIHGFGMTKESWYRVVAALEDKYHVIVLDLLGHGESVSSKSLDYSLTQQAKRVSLFLKSKNINEVYLLGHSMGGAIALRYAQAHADNLSALILIASFGITATKSDGMKLLEESDTNQLYAVCTKEQFETLFSYIMHKKPYIPEAIQELLLAQKCARRELEKVIYEAMMQDVNISDVVKNIQIPTLILWGEKDRLTHVDNASLFHHTIEGSKLQLLKNTGHMLPLEKPGKTAELIDRFIGQNIHQ